MSDFASYFIWLIVLIIIFVMVRIFCTVMCRKLSSSSNSPTVRRRVIQRIRIDPANTQTNANNNEDHQGNIFTISDDAAVNRDSRGYPEYYFLQSSNNEAARIRAQIEKDEKDLPSYEEVMRISAMAANATTIANNATTITIPDTVPPYSAVDPVTPPAHVISATSATSINMPVNSSIPTLPSTSHSVIADTTTITTSTVAVVPIANTPNQSNV